MNLEIEEYDIDAQQARALEDMQESRREGAQLKTNRYRGHVVMLNVHMIMAQ